MVDRYSDAQLVEKEHTMDLTATYVVTYPGDDAPTTITPKVSQRTTSSGAHLTSVRRIAPLLADHIDAISDEGDRLHTLTALQGAVVTISDQPRRCAKSWSDQPSRKENTVAVSTADPAGGSE